MILQNHCLNSQKSFNDLKIAKEYELQYIKSIYGC